MSAASHVTLPEALERAASALPELADAVRPANGDPQKLLDSLDAEAAARVLDWLLRHEPEAGGELAASWAEDPERGPAALLAVAGEALPKTGRKALRRARHRLRSRGLDVPERAPAPRVATLPPIEDRLEAALVSSIDPRGTRLVYLIEPNPSGGARLFEVVLDEQRGVVGLEVYSAGRSRVRGFVRQATQRAAGGAVEAPPQSVRALVGRVAAAQPSDRPLPRGFSEWRSSLAAAPEGSPTPGELARQALGEAGDEAAVERVAERFRQGALGPWSPDASELRELADELVEIGEGRIIVSGLRRREQIEQAKQQALVDLFGDRFAAATAGRLEESAYVLWKTHREEEARDCLAAARAFREQPAADNPVARAMLDVVLAPVLSGLEKKLEDEEQSSLLVKP